MTNAFVRCLKLVASFWQLALNIFLWFLPYRFRFKKDIKKEIALVTGAGSGLGRALALRLAARGAKVILWDLRRSQVEETQNMIRNSGGKAWSFVCDVTDKRSVQEAATKVKNRNGAVAILINCSGQLLGKRFSDLDEESVGRTLSHNALAHFWTCKSFLPDMKANNQGHVVQVASAFRVGITHELTNYCSSHQMALHFSSALRSELQDNYHTGIKVTVVLPYVHGSRMLIEDGETDRIADATMDGILTNTFFCVVPWRWTCVLSPKIILNLLLNFTGMCKP